MKDLFFGTDENDAGRKISFCRRKFWRELAVKWSMTNNGDDDHSK